MWLQEARLHQCRACLAYLEDSTRAKPQLLVNMEKPLPSRQAESPHPRLLRSYSLINAAVYTPAQMQKQFNDEWEVLKSHDSIRNWRTDPDNYAELKRVLLVKWLNTAIESSSCIEPGAPTEEATADDGQGSESAPSAVEPPEVAPTEEATAVDGQGSEGLPSAVEPSEAQDLTPLQPAMIDQNLDLIHDYLHKFHTDEMPQSGYAAMLDELRSKPEAKLKMLGGKDMDQLGFQAFMLAAQKELLLLKEAKAVHKIWHKATTRPAQGRNKAEEQLNKAAVVTMSWWIDIQKYEDSVEDFVATMHQLPHGRILQLLGPKSFDMRGPGPRPNIFHMKGPGLQDFSNEGPWAPRFFVSRALGPRFFI